MNSNPAQMKLMILYMQVDDYPSLLFYKAGDKTNPVIAQLILIFHVITWSQSMVNPFENLFWWLQIKLSTKSSLKDLAGSINKHLKARDKVTKDEL